MRGSGQSGPRRQGTPFSSARRRRSASAPTMELSIITSFPRSSCTLVHHGRASQGLRCPAQQGRHSANEYRIRGGRQSLQTQSRISGGSSRCSWA